jgi:hypothetical protein
MAWKAQEGIAATTLGEVEGHCSLKVRPGHGRDAEAEGGSEGTNDIEEWVQITDRFEKLRTCLARVEGLVEVDVDICDLVVLVKGWDVLNRVVGSHGRGRLGEDANPNSDITDNRFLSLYCFFISIFFVLGCFVNLDHLETNDIYCRKADLEIPVSKFYDTMDT